MKISGLSSLVLLGTRGSPALAGGDGSDFRRRLQFEDLSNSTCFIETENALYGSNPEIDAAIQAMEEEAATSFNAEGCVAENETGNLICSYDYSTLSSFEDVETACTEGACALLQ